ncbi:MAG: efflux transporter outer membrane subunit [Sphingomonadales bacterium]|nr:efflux transporter outer membrane subunit [Sphingomonadales bacterium]MDE2171120.1 efflux transporter outer membrane subunit [Sphingomonadales bacterium]
MPRPIIALLLASSLLGGCATAPTYHRPDIAQPLAYKEAPDWTPAHPADDQPRGTWWQVFGDSDLDAIETRVTAANQDLKAAAARVAEARALARGAKADRAPQVGLAAGSSAAQLSRSVSNPLPDQRPNDQSLGLAVSYEPDVWGRISNAANAAGAKAEASAGDLGAARLSLQADAAITYFALRGDDARITELEAEAADDADLVIMSTARLRAGHAPGADLAAAQTAHDRVVARLAETRLDRAQREHALAILMGEAPSAFTLRSSTLGPGVPSVDPVLPGALLERRPDIAAAERRVAAANAEVGVARAAFYPRFTLGGLIGAETAAPSPLFGANALTWAIGASGVVNLFDGGRRRAATAEARARFDEAAALYRQSVLNAYGEVEDGLAAIRQLKEEDDRAISALKAAHETRVEAEARQKAGYATGYESIAARDAERATRLDHIDTLTRRKIAAAALVKALGGGWTGAE